MIRVILHNSTNITKLTKEATFQVTTINKYPCMTLTLFGSNANEISQVRLANYKFIIPFDKKWSDRKKDVYNNF